MSTHGGFRPHHRLLADGKLVGHWKEASCMRTQNPSAFEQTPSTDPGTGAVFIPTIQPIPPPLSEGSHLPPFIPHPHQTARDWGVYRAGIAPAHVSHQALETWKWRLIGLCP
ncbi:hypothetical protein NPIL_173251 [Nephila pilipes]|uniref:Uncharacterized protein n=1 Tax=Nephila pilipes TaxID=299642 RepID=A0A8X6UFV5_NEPPI|nr:hypothetical protein NPIL_173251 [Nephila pilipes]